MKSNIEIGKLFIASEWDMLWFDFICLRNKWWAILIPKFMNLPKVIELYWLGILLVWEK